MAAFTNLNKHTIGKACRKFQSRLKAVLKVYGDLIEYI